MQMFSPPLSAGEIDGVPLSSHTRCLKRKSLSSSAPTGHRSTTFPASLLLHGWPGKMSISSRCPRPSIYSSLVPLTPRVIAVVWQRDAGIETCLKHHLPVPGGYDLAVHRDRSHGGRIVAGIVRDFTISIRHRDTSRRMVGCAAAPAAIKGTLAPA